jgi:hypothetical protein
MEQADGRYARASAEQPEFLRPYHEQAIAEIRARKDLRPE